MGETPETSRDSSSSKTPRNSARSCRSPHDLENERDRSETDDEMGLLFSHKDENRIGRCVIGRAPL